MKQVGIMTMDDGTTVVTTDVRTFTWVMEKAGHVFPEQQDTGPWAVITGHNTVFAVAPDEKTAKKIQAALRNAGLQGPSRVERH